MFSRSGENRVHALLHEINTALSRNSTINYNPFYSISFYLQISKPIGIRSYTTPKLGVWFTPRGKRFQITFQHLRMTFLHTLVALMCYTKSMINKIFSKGYDKMSEPLRIPNE